MLAKIRRLFRDEGQEEVETSRSEKALFILRIGELEVGSLSLAGGTWEFRYAAAFTQQAEKLDGVQPLVDFPAVGKLYRSEQLWPFFMARIPSLSQPQVLEEIQRLGLDQRSAAQLLRAFGEHTIANPFELQSA